MTRLEKIEQEISELDADEFERLRDRVLELDAERWDRRIESDAVAGRLDRLGSAALTAHRAGRSRPL